MARVAIEVNEFDLKRLVVADLSSKLGVQLSDADVVIEVKSTNNYKAEWERAAFRARVEKIV